MRDLCAFFGTEARPGEEYWSLAALTGRRVRALWYQRGGTMDGLELDGRRFMLWEWRRWTFPNAEVLDPRADQIATLRRQIASHERRLAELRDELSEAVDAAYDWLAVARERVHDDVIGSTNLQRMGKPTVATVKPPTSLTMTTPVAATRCPCWSPVRVYASISPGRSRTQNVSPVCSICGCTGSEVRR